MSDLSSQGLYQQLHARPVSGEHLEVLGKRASAEWRAGRARTLTEAVGETVKQAGLSPEQVKRVCEFANTDAFLTEFKKEGQAARIVDFGGEGPADPSDVIKGLNSGAAPLSDDGLSDYRVEVREKHAAALQVSDEDFFSAFKGETSGDVPYSETMTDAWELREKLAGTLDHMTSDYDRCCRVFDEASEAVYGHVKQAALSGISLGQVLRIWEGRAPSLEHVKVACEEIIPRLMQEGVFSEKTLEASIQKTASVGVVNPEHPLLRDFAVFCDAATKIAHIGAGRREVATALEQIEVFMKKANAAGAGKTTLRSILDTAAHYGGRAEEAVRPFVEKHVVSGPAAESVAKAVGGAVKYAPHAVGVGAAYNGLQRANEVANHPLGRKALSYVPFTDANQQEHQRRLYEAQMGQVLGV